jgi:4-amino-4-deoxy-L-arabinose transferase-like glycosyltransferase
VRPQRGLTRRRQAGAWSLLLLLGVFHLLNNGLWLATNEVVYGHDRMTHQVISLEYDDILAEGVNLRTLFAALTHSGYYPPLVHLSAVAFYKLFGVSMDVAALSNSLFLALLLLAAYGLGERFGGPWGGQL